MKIACRETISLFYLIFQVGTIGIVSVCASWGEPIPDGVTFSRAFDIKFAKPLWFGEVPGKPGHYLVLEQHAGNVMLVEPAAGGHASTLFHHVGSMRRENEMGLLGMAFHPGFPSNRKYYIHYIPATGEKRSIIEERRARMDLKKDSGNPGRLVMEVARANSWHNGGTLMFGKDGFLYISFGDNGQRPNAQTVNSLFGSILRIDVDKPADGRGYGIPVDNPHAGKADGDVKKEVFAKGFRNPWRFSFDPLNGDLWVGDVGDNTHEEIDIVRTGENFGWNYMEGFRCLNGGSGATCGRQGITLPVAALHSDSANSITGGFVYRGNSGSAFYGVYIFGDYEQRHVWGLRQENRKMTEIRKLGRCPEAIASFGQDLGGNLYAVGHAGYIYKLNHPELKAAATRLHHDEKALDRGFLLPGPAGSFRVKPEWLMNSGLLRIHRSDGSLSEEAFFGAGDADKNIRLASGLHWITWRGPGGGRTAQKVAIP